MRNLPAKRRNGLQPFGHPSWGVRTWLLARTLQGAARRVTALHPASARSFLDALGHLAPPVAKVRRRRALIGGVPCEWYVPAGAEPGPICVHVHGGGYALCSTSTHRLMISDIAAASGLRCLGIDYRLAPEHPFPAGLEDCLAVLRGLAAEGTESGDVVLCGDSAGASIALAAMVQLRDDGHPLPRAAVFLSPWTDLECKGATVEENAPFDYLSATVMHFFADLYLQGEDPRQGLASPVHADLRGLPPILVHAGGAELLLDDIRSLVARLEDADVEVKLEVWEGMMHAFHGFTLFLPEARDALRSLGVFIRGASERAA